MDELDAFERRFRHAGLPLLIENYSATEDVFTRAAPVLTLVFLGEMLGAIQLDWSLLANVAAAVGGLAILLLAFCLVNRLRGRPFWSFPEDVSRVSGGIAVFSGLYWAVAVLTDATYRAEFLDELTREMRETFKARADYLALRARA